MRSTSSCLDVRLWPKLSLVSTLLGFGSKRDKRFHMIEHLCNLMLPALAFQLVLDPPGQLTSRVGAASSEQSTTTSTLPKEAGKL